MCLLTLCEKFIQVFCPFFSIVSLSLTCRCFFCVGVLYILWIMIVYQILQMFYPTLWLAFLLSYWCFKQKFPILGYLRFFSFILWQKKKGKTKTTNLSHFSEMQCFHKWSVYIGLSMFLGSLFCLLWCLFSPLPHCLIVHLLLLGVH